MPENNPVNVIMVGPSGVGKTSLLASMYYHIRTEVQQLGCTFVCGPTYATDLDDRLEELKSLAVGRGLSVDLDLGPKPGTDERRFDFQLNVAPNVPNVKIDFIDLPGGWYMGQGDFERADTLLAQSQIIVVAVDAWALMEEKDDTGVGKYNILINRPAVICQALERAIIANASKPACVLFVLVKAEKYLHDGSHEDLFNTAKKCYSPHLKGLVDQKIPIAGIWVETVGGIELNHVYEKDGSPWGNFRRLQGEKAGYNPRHCSVPLRFVFKLALEERANHLPTGARNSWEALTIFVAEMLCKETDLTKSIKTHTKLKQIAQELSGRLEGEPLAWFNQP